MFHTDINTSKKIINGLVLASALYLALSCPCDTYLTCHKAKYLALLAIGAGFAYSS